MRLTSCFTGLESAALLIPQNNLASSIGLHKNFHSESSVQFLIKNLCDRRTKNEYNAPKRFVSYQRLKN